MESWFINCRDLRAIREQAQGRVCIVGLGNNARRDDGAGPWVVERLKEALPPSERVRLLTRPQLDADLLDDAACSDLMILVDACLKPLEKGIDWSRIQAGKGRAPLVIHSLEPEYLLDLAGAVHRRIPALWLVSIQGEDFCHGEGLSCPAQMRAHRVMEDLLNIIAGEDGT